MGDYELWYRAKMNGLRIENIRDVLVKYRKSSSQIGSRNLYDRVEKLRKFLSFRLDRMGVKLSTIDEDLLFRFIRTRIEIGPSEFKSLRDIFDKIESANESKKLLPRYSFKAALLFYRLRLGRYYYAINRQNYFGLISYIAVQLIHAGFRSIFLFIRNEI